MTGKAQKLLDILSFGLYNTRINKNIQKEKIMADQPNYTDAMVSELVAAYEDAPTRATVDESAIKNFFNSRGILWSQDIDLPVISGKRYFNGFGELDAVGFVYGDQSQPSAIKWRAIHQKAFTQEGAARHFYGIEF